MPYIIDGHNLIPKIPGIDLQDLDDEQKLIDSAAGICAGQPGCSRGVF